MDNKTKILIAFPFVFVTALFIAANYFPFKGGLTDIEDRVLAFTPASLSIKERPAVSVSGEIKSPIDFSSPAVSASVEKEGDLVPEMDYNDTYLSLIVISGKRKMAIIKGSLVREGESIDGMKIARIEPDRVLVKNKTEKWLYLERAK